MRHPLRSTATLGVGGLVSLIAVAAGHCGPADDTTRPDPIAAAPSPTSFAETSTGTDVEGVGRDVTASTTPLPSDPPDTAPPASTAPATAGTAPPVDTPANVAPATQPTTVAPAPETAPPPQEPPPAQAVPQSAPTPIPATEPPTPTEPPPTHTVAPPPSGSTSEAVALANEQRLAAGLPALASVDALASAAIAHSIDQATMQSATHTGSDGSSPADRVASAGFAAGAVAENVAAGYGTPAAVIAGWMGSGPHRENLLNPAYTAIGVASAQAGDGTLYWTMVLAG